MQTASETFNKNIQELVDKKYNAIIKSMSMYNIHDITYYHKYENHLIQFIKNNAHYLGKNEELVRKLYDLDISDKYLIIQDVDTDSLVFRAPEVIISYAEYIAKYLSVQA